MKKVRFESPIKIKTQIPHKMEDRECQSPRPFTEQQLYHISPDIYSNCKVVPYSKDPVQRFECSNSSPYPLMNKTNFIQPESHSRFLPCNDLELSMLDASNQEPRKPASILKTPFVTTVNMDKGITRNISQSKNTQNDTVTPHNVLLKDNFFLKRGQFSNRCFDVNPAQKELNSLCRDKENNPYAQKAQFIEMSTTLPLSEMKQLKETPNNPPYHDCMCHHCVKNISNHAHNDSNEQIFSRSPDHSHHTRSPDHNHHARSSDHNHVPQNTQRYVNCMCSPPTVPSRCSCCNCASHPSSCNTNNCDSHQIPNALINAVDKKKWAIEKYEQSKNTNTMEVEKQTNVTKEKREPTVSDLFKIIKLQNEQLQLLQEKVDKFISSSQQNHTIPIQNCASEHIAIENLSDEHHKISIGVMTSFEMVRTSTVINKEVLKTNENSQIQTKQAHVCIKEVVSNVQPNFLDGITPVDKSVPNALQHIEVQNANEEKTLNELSLYNVQVENAITPLMSPDQTLYLDVRDYSDSEAESNDQSNVGWTYYNKVMTHVNGILQDSDMPSSASALYRNTRQQVQTLQMQIDKTNVSVTKRVKFGDDPPGIRQGHIYTASTDTSLKINQLAAKYLKGAPAPGLTQQVQRPNAAPIDMSFATRNYMERHKLLQGVPASSKSPIHPEMPRFLDITALKQQPKFL